MSGAKGSEGASERNDARPCVRPCVRGKFIFAGEEKLYIRGVTYGPFRPDENGDNYHDPETVERDFRQMAANGLNAVRTYTMPPGWLLDIAQQHGLRVMVGLNLEWQAILAYDKQSVEAVEERVRTEVRACAGHPAILCYTIGNEIPAPVVRWHGPRRVERWLERFYRIVKAQDPDGLVTYVNYPSTEYLQLPFIDFACFNVYLESQERLEAYLARLHNIVGDRPLVMGEIGLDSRRNGEDGQARTLDWQVRTAFESGCAGTFVFAWTDEWFRGGFDIEDWDFGLTGRLPSVAGTRTPKPALEAVSRAFAEAPFPKDLPWPRVSVVVCTYNGARTLRDCLEGLLKLEYPNFDVIVVDDGSTDGTAGIALEFGDQGSGIGDRVCRRPDPRSPIPDPRLRLISTENRGLSSARNTGLHAATGEIVAYLDDDAYPDPHWLIYLAADFMSAGPTVAGLGGPNIAPPGDGSIAECVANAPGGPMHILLSDRVAEHIPGCNMAFRKSCLLAIGGFDPQFRVAGDDVDVCWRLQQAGWTLGFSPAAMVWHHRRNSVRAYWRQQRGYGKAEVMLERKWPEKYNTAGHITWAGRVYGRGVVRTPRMVMVRRIYYGTWGSRLFQSMEQPTPGPLASVPMMPEWYLVIGALAVLCALGLLWAPLLMALPFLGLSVGVLMAQAGVSAAQASYASARACGSGNGNGNGRMPKSRVGPVKIRSLTALLYMLHPLARLYCRLRYGLTPWRALRSVSGQWSVTSVETRSNVSVQGPVGPRTLTTVETRSNVSLLRPLTAVLRRYVPGPRVWTVWSEGWRAADERLRSIEESVRAAGAGVHRGGDYDRWDLEVWGGLLGAARVFMATEEHGGGKQLIRFRSWPRYSTKGLVLAVLLAALCAGAGLDHALAACVGLGVVTIVYILRTFKECAAATAVVLSALELPDVQRQSAGAQAAGTAAAADAAADVVLRESAQPERGG